MNEMIERVRDLTSDLEKLENRKNLIKQKLQQHRSSVTADDVSEVKEIKSQISEVRAKLDLAKELANKKEFRGDVQKMETEKVNIRTAFAKQVLLANGSQRADIALTEAEKRALGVANTTTSETYVAPTASVDGVNNGGLFIPQQISLDILRDVSLDSPIFNDIRTTAIKGMTRYPYKFYKSGAKTKAELSPTDNESIEWKVLSGKTGNYTDSIKMTFEIEAMAIDEFADYLISEIKDSMRELIINDYIYGDGENDHMLGITAGAIDATYTASTDGLKALEDAIKKLPVKKRAGAKIYLASDLYDAITFAKDKNGVYLLPVLNGGGFSRLGTFEVVSDVNLNQGDFIIGNIGKWYKANVIKELELGVDVSNQNRTKTFTSHAMINAVAIPNSFVYGKKGSQQ